MSFWGELKRRNVFKVGAAYLVVAWLLAQIVDVVIPTFNAPQWVGQTIILVLALAFPIVLIIAWAFEITPEGLKPTASVAAADSITPVTGQRLNYIVTGLLVLALGFVIVDQYLLEGASSGTVTRDAAGPTGEQTGATPATTTPRAATLPATAESPQVLPNSVAVLPFENFSPNPDDAYFAAGIHEEILNYLVKLKSLNVIARTSMVQYAGTDKSVPQIAAELNVGTVMEGSVRYAGNRVRVTTQLIDANTGAHLWSDAYEREFDDIFAIQADIAMNVANALNAEFSPEEQRDIEQPRTASTAAYALYLQFLNLVGQGNQGPQALGLLDQILRNDPEFAAPYGQRAYIYANGLINTTIGSAGDSAELEALARENAERALALDPKDSFAHSALAAIELFSWRWVEAREVYERFRRETGLAAAYHHWFDAWTGRNAEAIEIAERAAALDPLIWTGQWMLGMALTYAGEYDAAVTALRQGIELAPTLSLQHSWLALAEIARGNADAASRELELAEQLLGNNRAVISLVDIAYAYGRVGRAGDARRLFDEIGAVAQDQDIGTGGWAFVYLGIGEEQRALESLREGAEHAANKVLDPGFFSLMNIKVNVTNDPVLEQPDFVAVRSRLSGD